MNTNIFRTISNIFKLTDDSFEDEATQLLKNKALNICVNMSLASEQ